MGSLSRNAVLAMVGLTLVLHTIEEYLTFPAFLLRPDERTLRWLPRPVLLHSAREIHTALLLATILPLLVIAWAMLRPSKVLLVAVLFLEGVLLVNAGWHILAALVRGGYAPDVATGLLINLPFGIYVLRRALREQWIRARGGWQLVGGALVLHVAWLGSFLAG